MKPPIAYTAFLRALMRVGIVAAAVAIYHGALNPAFLDAQGHFYGHDFMNVWAAPSIARADIAALFDIETYNQRVFERYGAVMPYHNWSYPPHALLLFDPIARLPHNFAFVLWSALGVWFYLSMLTKASGHRLQRVVLLALFSPAMLLNLFYGQNGFITAGLFLAALMSLERRPLVAGIALGLLTLKPHIGIVWPLVLLSKRCWKVIAIAALTASLLIALSIFVYGIGAWEGFFTITMPYQASLIKDVFGRTYEAMMVSWPVSFLRMGFSYKAGMMVHVAVAAYVLVTLWRSLQKPQCFSLLTLRISAAAMILTPYLFNYDMTLLTAALIIRFLAVPDMPRRTRILYGAGYLLPALVYWLYAFLPLAPLVLLAVYVAAQNERS